MLESKEEDEQTVVVVLKFASETLLSPSNVALAKRNPSLRPATKSSELIKFARRVKLCFVHLCYGWLGGLQGFQLELSQNILKAIHRVNFGHQLAVECYAQKLYVFHFPKKIYFLQTWSREM